MKIAISAETTVDLSEELLEKYDIKTVPFTVLLGEETKLDGDISPEDIFDFVDRTGKLPKTSAVNEFQYEEHFNALLKEYDAVIHFTLSNDMSSAYRNACLVAENLKNVYVIDSMSLSSGIGLLAIYARKLADKGLDVNEIVKKCKDRVKSVQASFVINTMEYLHKGGRCSSLTAFGANLLRLKPQIIVKNGKMESSKVFRGKNEEVVNDYCKATLEKFNKPDLSVAFVTHTKASPEMVEAAKAHLVKAGFKEIYDTTASCTISSHCGPKTIGILYINDGLKE